MSRDTKEKPGTWPPHWRNGFVGESGSPSERWSLRMVGSGDRLSGSRRRFPGRGLWQAGQRTIEPRADSTRKRQAEARNA